MTSPGRRVRVLVLHAGELLGALPGFGVASPWWADVEPVTAELDRRLGVRTAVLRLLGTTGHGSRGGEVTYLAEALSPPTRAPGWEPLPASAADALRPEEHRMPWAAPGGPAALLDWADAQLRLLGRPPTAAPVQVKSWNLGCLYRLSTAAGRAWIKCTAPFLAPESRAISHVGAHDPALVPPVLATSPDGASTLMAEIPGTDCWDADAPTVREVVARHVAAQAALAGDPLDGLPDHRISTLAARAERLLAPDVAATLTPAERAGLAELVDELPRRTAAIAAAGLPETLVHGDFHPGNWRSDGTRRVVLDWCDASRGNPASDLLRLAGWLPQPLAALATEVWTAAWRSAVPGCDPERAVALMAPVQNLEAALTYQAFLDGIEPDERPYHEGDPAEQIRAALAAPG